ncbi:MAG: hypothetical protein MUF83_15835 [Acidimicrobiales bacterium]|jgi:hypothetical protein|nr:hypothetical protein [Acidimicrobiales bacterium]
MAPRGVWADLPGRWAVVHAATPAVLDAARTHLAGASAPTDPKVGHTFLSDHGDRLVRREAGEPAPTQGDALAAAIAFASVDPGSCLGAYPYALPVQLALNAVAGRFVSTVQCLGVVLSTPHAPGGWQDACRAASPFRVPYDAPVIMGPTGPIRVERLRWAALAARAASGDRSVPASPVQLAVGFVETMGILPGDCWGVAELQPGHEASSAYAQVVYRPGPDDAAGRERFARYLTSLGLTPGDVDLGHPEGTVTFRRWGVRVVER